METVTELLEPLFPTSTGQPWDLGLAALGETLRREASESRGSAAAEDLAHAYHRPRPVPEPGPTPTDPRPERP